MDHLPTPNAVLVTGGAGWLGRALVRRLATEVTVVATVRDEDEAASLRAVLDPAATVEIVQADVTVPEPWDRTVTGAVDRHGVVDLVHTVGLIHPGRARDFDTVNRLGTVHVMGAARRAGIRRVVHVSSNSPFGTNPTPRDRFGEHEPYHPYLGYGQSKMAGELAVLDEVAAGLDAVIVRPPWFYGPWQPPRQTTFFRLVRTGRFPVIGTGDQRRSMIYVDDLVDGILAASRTEGVTGRGYWIADPEPYLVHDIVDTVRDALRACGLTTADDTVHLPAAAARVAERLDRVIQRAGGYQQQLHVLGEMGHTIAVDVDAARRDLGFEAGTGLAEGMRRSIRWCLEQGYEL